MSMVCSGIDDGCHLPSLPSLPPSFPASSTPPFLFPPPRLSPDKSSATAAIAPLAPLLIHTSLPPSLPSFLLPYLVRAAFSFPTTSPMP